MRTKAGSLPRVRRKADTLSDGATPSHATGLDAHDGNAADHGDSSLPAPVEAARALVETTTATVGDAVGPVFAAAASLAEDAVAPVASAARRVVAGGDRLASQARRKVGGSDAARVRRLRALNRQRLPSLYQAHPEARLAAMRELGLRTVAVSDIKGTAVEGSDQRGGDFLPLPQLRSRDWQQRWQRINRAVADLVVLPPVDLVKFGDEYWVVDGHNRVAAALYNDQVALDASVIERRPAGTRGSEPPSSLAAALEGSERLRSAARGHRPANVHRLGEPSERTGRSALLREPSREETDPSAAGEDHGDR